MTDLCALCCFWEWAKRRHHQQSTSPKTVATFHQVIVTGGVASNGGVGGQIQTTPLQPANCEAEEKIQRARTQFDEISERTELCWGMELLIQKSHKLESQISQVERLLFEIDEEMQRERTQRLGGDRTKQSQRLHELETRSVRLQTRLEFLKLERKKQFAALQDLDDQEFEARGKLEQAQQTVWDANASLWKEQLAKARVNFPPSVRFGGSAYHPYNPYSAGPMNPSPAKSMSPPTSPSTGKKRGYLSWMEPPGTTMRQIQQTQASYVEKYV